MFRHESRFGVALAIATMGLSLAGCGKQSPPAPELQTAPKFDPSTATPGTLPTSATPDAQSSTQGGPNTYTVAPDPAVPQLLHERDDYTVEPPDIVMVSVKLPSRDEEVRLRGVNGEHLVSPDGAINLGERFGMIPAAGLTPQEIQQKVQQCLAAEAKDYDVTISVAEQNSKVYYIIVQFEGSGDTVMRMPLVTGEEDVSHALQHVKEADLQGKQIWIARPTPSGGDTILPVNGDSAQHGWTMHRLQPGDRIFIAASKPSSVSK